MSHFVRSCWGDEVQTSGPKATGQPARATIRRGEREVRKGGMGAPVILHCLDGLGIGGGGAVVDPAPAPHSPADVRPCSLSHRPAGRAGRGDRKSTRLNSSHSQISYAVFCLKKK